MLFSLRIVYLHRDSGEIRRNQNITAVLMMYLTPGYYLIIDRINRNITHIMKKSIDIRVKGIVQGVGFRPFIYRIARKHNIQGDVLNDTEGVLIHAEGDESAVEDFISEIRENPPALSFISSISVIKREVKNFTDFAITKSRISAHRSTFVPPDIAVCDECLREFFNPGDRRFVYPFITCTNCGPRFSIVTDIPYDRVNTAMSHFRMCPDCSREYSDPGDRRFHTQPNACPACGPVLSLYKNDGSLILKGVTVAEKTVSFIRDGKIIAIKGVGGYLLAADAMSDEALSILRQRKGRSFKPFALMAGSIEKIREFLHAGSVDESLLLSKERPILLLREKKKYVSRLAAPGLSSIGIMLPYAPFQHQMFEINPDMILVMTSGNVSDEPIICRDEEAFAGLSHIADYFVAYNRDITAQSDDSVIFVEDEKPFFIRRSRGFVPVPFRSCAAPRHMLATGGDLKNSFALAKDGIIIMSQFLGDIASPHGNDLYRRTIDHFKRIYDFSPAAVISDMHPGYFTTFFADELEHQGIDRIKVQHHHAHIAAVLEENEIREKVIGIAYDGTGYGTDGTLWGSEFLIADRISFVRAAHFSDFSLPGGESAIRDVWKIGLSLLYRAYGRDFPVMKRSPRTEIVMEIIDKSINSPETCSTGRIFDGISAVLGISERISTEAEAAMLLEEAAVRGRADCQPYIIAVSDDASMIVSTEDLTRYIVSLIGKGESIDRIAYAFHLSIAETSVAVAGRLRERHGINQVALSGGVFQNRLILRLIIDGLKREKFKVLLHRKVPCNDGCIALGQLAVGKEIG